MGGKVCSGRDGPIIQKTEQTMIERSPTRATGGITDAERVAMEAITREWINALIEDPDREHGNPYDRKDGGK